MGHKLDLLGRNEAGDREGAGMDVICHGLRAFSPADMLPAPLEGPRCPVCGKQLGQAVYLDVVSQENGGEFRVTCLARDQAHEPPWHGFHRIAGLQGAGWVLAHVGRKAWADSHNALAALWPWLKEVAA